MVATPGTDAGLAEECALGAVSFPPKSAASAGRPNPIRRGERRRHRVQSRTLKNKIIQPERAIVRAPGPDFDGMLIGWLAYRAAERFVCWRRGRRAAAQAWAGFPSHPR